MQVARSPASSLDCGSPDGSRGMVSPTAVVQPTASTSPQQQSGAPSLDFGDTPGSRAVQVAPSQQQVSGALSLDFGATPGSRAVQLTWSLPPRLAAQLSSPPPRLASSTEPFNIEQETSVLLHIRDELEEEADCIEESTEEADIADLLLADDSWPEDIMTTLACVPCETTTLAVEPSKPDGDLSTRYIGFRCLCSSGNCLEALTGRQMREAYSATHPSFAETPPGMTNAKLHTLLWGQKVPLRAPNGRGHNYKIAQLRYDGLPLCRQGYEVLMGASAWGMRQAVSLVLRGISPHDVESERGAALMLATETRVESEASEKQRLTVNWLHRCYLCTMEYMPNENRIVLRGLGTKIVHSDMYTTAARKGGFYLSYKQFMLCMHAAAVACVEEDHGRDPEGSAKVKVRRSARHSNFAQCTTCATLSKDYISVSSDPLADPADVKKAKEAWVAHQVKFMADRTLARRMRYGSHDHMTSGDVYECDDKCGSFWCKIPVEGRTNKDNVKQVYEFAVQANVVCGPEGVLRLSIIPKSVNTGANFGLSTLLSALYSAFKKGRLKPHVKRLVRHTDGGSDNVAKVTHIFNWLLVYIGCWEELLWFIFDAGHSHTEIADRLFSLMKKLFETDSAAHVRGGIASFEDLEEKLKEVFSKCPEMKEIVYHFANWDFNTWLKGAVGFKESDLALISFDNVWRYRYVGALPCQDVKGRPSTVAREHGGVQVTYKQNLSDQAPSYYDDEYAPLKKVSETSSSGEPVAANRTLPEGLVFVASPPNLSREPPREEVDEKGAVKPRAAINRVLKRKDILGSGQERERAFWHALYKVHGSGLAEDIPNLPCAVAANHLTKDSAHLVSEGGGCKKVSTHSTSMDRAHHPSCPF